MVFNLQDMDLAIIRCKTEIPHSGGQVAKAQRGWVKVGAARSWSHVMGVCPHKPWLDSALGQPQPYSLSRCMGMKGATNNGKIWL